MGAGQCWFPVREPDARPTFKTCSVWSLIRSMSWMYTFKSMFGSSPAVLRNPKVTSMTDRASQASLYDCSCPLMVLMAALGRGL